MLKPICRQLPALYLVVKLQWSLTTELARDRIGA